MSRDYIPVLRKLHPQPNMEGNFLGNLQVTADVLEPADDSITYLKTALSPIGYELDGTGQYINNYLSLFSSLPLAPSTSDTPINKILFMVGKFTEYAKRGFACMLPYGALHSTSTVFTNASHTSTVSYPVWQSQIGGWLVNIFENTLPFFRVGGQAWPGEPKDQKLYATPLDGVSNILYDEVAQWNINVELIPSDETVSLDIVKNAILTAGPAWVKFNFYNNPADNIDQYPGYPGTETWTKTTVTT